MKPFDFLGIKFIPLLNGKRLYKDMDQQVSGFILGKHGTNYRLLRKTSFPKHLELLDKSTTDFPE